MVIFAERDSFSITMCIILSAKDYYNRDMVKRNRRRTTQQVKDDIITAVGNVLAKQGVGKLGVETVAAEAGMDKAMLYRHYKDFNDILRTYVEQEDFWINFLNTDPYLLDENNLAPYVSKMLENQFNELLSNNKLQEFIIWELVDKSQLMKDIAQKREDMALGILKEVQTNFPHKTVSSNNMLAIISAGIYYLALHKDITSFCTIDLNNKVHREKFLTDLSWLIERVFSPISETERIALNCIKKGLDNALIAEITGMDVKRIEGIRSLGVNC